MIMRGPEDGGTRNMEVASSRSQVWVPSPPVLIPRLSHLNRSSNAFRALEPGAASLPADAAGLPVWRSMVVRGVNIWHMLPASFGATRAVSVALCVHSQRAEV